MITSFQYQIYYEDTDAGGVVYYANYLKFLERARTDFLLSKGISQVALGRDGIFFVVKKCEIDYKGSAILEDIITVNLEIKEISKFAIVFYQTISVRDTVIIHATIKVVCVKKVGDVMKINSIPQDIISLI